VVDTGVTIKPVKIVVINAVAIIPFWMSVSEPIVDENAIIEIVSPILKKGNYKWRGIYKGVPLSFNMKSNEFKTLVQTGKVEFKNGSTINCVLEINRKMNSDGEEIITGYDIISVNENSEND